MFNELRQIAKWYNVKYAKNINKEALLNLLIEKLYVPSENEEPKSKIVTKT